MNNESTPDELKIGAKRIAMRRKLVLVLCIIYVPLAALVFYVLETSPQIKAIFNILLIFICGSLLYWSFSKCPRCKKRFFGKIGLGNPFSNQCHYCGFRI